MKNAGSLLLFLGIGTIVLNFIGYEFAILSWIDNWGETVGWVIRGAMIAVGAVLLIMGMRSPQAEPAAEQPVSE